MPFVTLTSTADPGSVLDVLAKDASKRWYRCAAFAVNDLRRAAAAVCEFEPASSVLAAGWVIAPGRVIAFRTDPTVGSVVRLRSGESVRVRAVLRSRNDPDLAIVEVDGSLPAHIPVARTATDDDAAVLGSRASSWIGFGRFSPGQPLSRLDADGPFPNGALGAPIVSLSSGEAIGLVADGGGVIPVSRIAALAEELGLSLPPGRTAIRLAESLEGLERRVDPSEYDDRTGYDENFIGIAVPLPTPTGPLAGDVLSYMTTKNTTSTVLPYTHFSVVMSRSRRLSMFTAVNILGTSLQSLGRDGVPWRLDPRLADEAQFDNALYVDNDLDRGHMVRRLDPVWGDDAEGANSDTFHYTNSCPQHKDLNQKIWNDLEEYIYRNAGQENLKVNVFTGPVFSDEDMPYRGAKIPLQFWKVVSIIGDAGRLSATAYILSQADMISGLEFAFGEFRTYQLPIVTLEKLTHLDFGSLREFDPKKPSEAGFESAEQIYTPINGWVDVVLDNDSTSRTPLEKLEKRLKDRLSEYDWVGVDSIVDELIRAISALGQPVEEQLAKHTVGALRDYRRFDALVRLSGAIEKSGLHSAKIKRLTAQAFLDVGRFPEAQFILERLIADQGAPAEERDEATGLMGRLHKQAFVNVEKQFGEGRPEDLQKAIDYYSAAYSRNAESNHWQGVNAAALLSRKGDRASASDLAAKILESLDRKTHGAMATDDDLWVIASQMEAYIALGRNDEAVNAAREYFRAAGITSFALEGTRRQLEEIWRLSDGSDPGKQILPLIRDALAKRPAGRINLSRDALNPDTAGLQRRFGAEGSQSIAWLLMAIERSKSVARIEQAGRGVGTGWLVRARDFFPSRPDGEIVLLTNAHVIANPPAKGGGVGVPPLLPWEAQIHFLGGPNGGSMLGVRRVVWSSPVDQLDASFLELEGVLPNSVPIPLCPAPMKMTTPAPRMYVIGCPGGRDLEISLHDNRLVAFNETRLHYRSPTEGGSSGSPVFEPNGWRAVALHHSGKDRMTAIDGSGNPYQANEGISILAIQKAAREAVLEK